MVAGAVLAGCGPSASGDGSGDGGGGGGGGGGSPFDPSVTCGLAVEFSGAFDAAVTPSDEIACTTPFASKDNVGATFAGTSSDEPTVVLSFSGLPEGQTGTDLAGQIEIHKGQTTWTGDSCTVAVTANVMTSTGDFGDNYRIEGNATCDPAQGSTGGGQLDIGPLDFVMSVTWP